MQITVSEELGVGTRGGYYDQSGALRDMIQNHVMQLLALLPWKPPSSLDPESIRNEKVKALQALKPIVLDGPDPEVVRGVYTQGLVGDEKVLGYLEESGIPNESSTETFAALCLHIENWRWKRSSFLFAIRKKDGSKG